MQELIVIMGAAYLHRTRKRKHRWWVHALNQQRKNFEVYHHLLRKLGMDKERFQMYFRLNQTQFADLLTQVGPHLTREAISPGQKLAKCLRSVLGTPYLHK